MMQRKIIRFSQRNFKFKGRVITFLLLDQTLVFLLQLVNLLLEDSFVFLLLQLVDHDMQIMIHT